MNLHWYLSRLRRMSPAEILWRARQSARARLDARRATPSQLSTDATKLVPDLGFPDCTQAIRYFDRSFIWYYEDLPWQGAPELNHLATRHWTTINYRDTAAYGDPKYTWELNRHQFLRNWITDEVDRKQALPNLQLLITQWIAQNPYGYGINWTSSLELALRLISWQSAMQALRTLDYIDFNPRFLDILHRSVREHANHLRRYPSLYSSANNHRIGELVGELAAATLFPDDQDLRTGATRAWSDLQQEAKLQVSEDGVSREQATFYHAYVLLYFKRAATYADTLLLTIPGWFPELITRMQTFLDATTGDDGNWFEIGDRDDGNLVALTDWLTPSEYQEFHRRAYDEHGNGNLNEISQELDRAPEISVSSPPGFHPFPDGGYAIWKTRDHHVLFRAGNFGYPSIAAHAHCDQLSVLLKYKGRDILTDSGTYSYHDEDRWRRYFKSTAAHNTVRVDGHEQAEYGGPFLWMTAPDARFDKLESTSTAATLTILYPTGTVVHRREVTFNPDAPAFLSVIDKLTPEHSTNSHTCELIWNLAPGLSIYPNSPNESGTQFRFTIAPAGEGLFSETSIHAEITTSTDARLQIQTGDESILAGFYSRAFGKKEPITQIRIAATTTAAWQVTSTFSHRENP